MKIRNFIILAACAALAMGAHAQRSPLTAQIAPYAFPENKPAAPPSFTYAPDGNGYLMLSPNGRTVGRYDVATGKLIETIFDAENTRETTLDAIEGFELSQNGRYLLVYTDSKPIYRRSFTAQYYVYELRSRLLKPLSTEHPRQQAPLISPDGRMIAFVAEDNNIYVRKNDYGSEVAVTKDGEKNKIINGVPDWVNEEEFSTSRSMAWAPDNLMLCYLKYDEAAVPMYTLPLYEGTCHPMEQYAYYPGAYSYKYPVAGEKNAVTTLHAYDVETRKTKDIALPDSKIEYLPRIAYGGDSPERLMVCALNRDQNRLDIYSVNPKTTVAKSVYSEESKAWIEPATYEDVRFDADGFTVLSSRTGHAHLYKYTYAGALARTLTRGDFDVTACYGYDAKGACYYQAALPTPMDRTVVRIDLKGNTQTISKPSGTTSASFSPALDWAMLRYSDAQTPPVYTINQASGKQARVLEDNAAYAARYASAPKREFFTMTTEGGVTLNGYVIRSASASGPVPVVMSQYSGPGSQTVINAWSMDWENYFAMNGYAIVCVDGRGTGGRGTEFMQCVYKRLGHFETIDQVAAARWAKQQPWCNGQVGIYGWSYGGYQALMCASADGCPYAAAVAIAPVTSWRYYDSIYTERYMLTPQQNAEGYTQGSPIYRVPQLACPLLIMYGTADDNVHPQNSLQYVSVLQSIGGLCDMYVFPNMNHSINGCNARAVVYARMLDFFNNKLK